MNKDEARLKELVNEFFKDDPDRRLRDENGLPVAPKPTIRRWASGENFPHKQAIKHYIELFEKLLGKK